MKIKVIAIIIVIFISSIFCYGQKITNIKLVNFLNEYRSAKSLDYAIHGVRWGTEELDKKYLHRNIITMANSFKPIIYVMKNDFTLENIEVVTEKYFVEQYGRDNIYSIKGYETIIAIIKNSKVEYFEEPYTENAAYAISIDSGKPEIFMDGMWNAFYILEKDIPILLERLKRTKATY